MDLPTIDSSQLLLLSIGIGELHIEIQLILVASANYWVAEHSTHRLALHTWVLPLADHSIYIVYDLKPMLYTPGSCLLQTTGSTLCKT